LRHEEKTSSGLQKASLMKNKRGKVVTKKQHAKGKALFQKYAQRWLDAVMKAAKPGSPQNGPARNF
jgi:hypothetical protein